MRKLFVFFVLIIICSNCFSQEKDKNECIQHFIKIWGLIKYHDVSVAQGNTDWDSVFVNTLPAIISAANKEEFNKQVLNIIPANAGLDEIITSNACDDNLFQLNKTSYSWIANSSILTEQVKQKLLIYSKIPAPSANKYINIKYNTADYSGEKKYDSISFPGMSYCLLFLARSWNIINYFAPYKYLTTDWDKVLLQFIPEFIQAQDEKSYYKTLQQFCKSFNDGHSQFSLNGQMLPDLYFGKFAAPFYCIIVDGQVVIRNTGSDSIANSYNIQKGDIILSIDNKNISQVIAEKSKYISASNPSDEANQLSHFIADGDNQKATLQLKRNNKIINTSFTRIPGESRNWGALINYSANENGYKMLNDSVLLIYAMQIWNGNLDTIKHLIKKSSAVIFDVRNYPQNDAFYMVPDLFLQEPASIDYSTVAMPSKPGYFSWNLNPNKIGHANDSAYKGKVIILCDAKTQSQGEYSCMVLQTISGAVTIGSETAGADGIVTNIPMGGAMAISYSGYGVYYPDKTQTQRVGVKINISVKQTVKGIQQGKDEILERALLYINIGK